jgi:hypothetical protein
VKPAAQSGQATVEYLLVATALVVALFYPMSQQGSVAEILVHVLINCFKSQSFVFSIL